MMCSNAKLDNVNMNAHTKIGGTLFICSQDIKRKRNCGVNQGPLLWYIFVKIICNNTNVDLVNINA